MGGLARVERRKIDEFNRSWNDLYQAFPQARSEAVKAMGEAVRKDLDKQIEAADLETGAKKTVKSWQTLRLGSKGGYAAVTPTWADVISRKGKGKVWKGTRVGVGQVTRWLERGHGVRKPSPGSIRQWSRYSEKTQRNINKVTGYGFVKARQFYSFTKLDAVDHALEAAETVLVKISDEVDY